MQFLFKSILLLFLLYVTLDAKVFQYQGVLDGDTIKFTGMICRAYGIDALEIKKNTHFNKIFKKCNYLNANQVLNAGKEAENYANKQFAGAGHYLVKLYNKNMYNNVCSIEKYDGKDFSIEMVKDGYAVPYYKYLTKNERTYYKMAMYQAKLQKKGLWKNNSNVMQCLLDSLSK